MFIILLAVLQEPKQVVSRITGPFSLSVQADKEVDTFDVVVCGGTLGIFIATALSARGLRVGVVERNLLKGVYYNPELFGIECVENCSSWLYFAVFDTCN